MICWVMNLTRQLEIKEAGGGVGERGLVQEILMKRKLKMMKLALFSLSINNYVWALTYVKLIVNLLQSTPSFDFVLIPNDDLCLWTILIHITIWLFSEKKNYCFISIY